MKQRRHRPCRLPKSAQHYCHQSDFTLLCEKTRSLASDNEGSAQTALNRRIRPDGEVVDAFGLPHGYWEAQDTHDDLYTEASKKFAAGYPSKNNENTKRHL